MKSSQAAVNSQNFFVFVVAFPVVDAPCHHRENRFLLWPSPFFCILFLRLFSFSMVVDFQNLWVLVGIGFSLSLDRFTCMVLEKASDQVVIWCCLSHVPFLFISCSRSFCVRVSSVSSCGPYMVEMARDREVYSSLVIFMVSIFLFKFVQR